MQHKKAADAIAALKAELSNLPDPEEAVREKQAELDRLESAAAALRKEITKITAETRVAKMRIEGRIKLLESNLMESDEDLLHQAIEFSLLPRPSEKNDGNGRERRRLSPEADKNRVRKAQNPSVSKLFRRTGSKRGAGIRKPSDARPGDVFDQVWEKLGEKLRYWRKKLRL